MHSFRFSSKLGYNYSLNLVAFFDKLPVFPFWGCRLSQLKLDLAKLFDLQVLVIESDQDLLHLIKQMLHSLGIKKLTSLSNVEELLNNKEKLSYDVIFLDYQLEEHRTGAEIVEELIMLACYPTAPGWYCWQQTMTAPAMPSNTLTIRLSTCPGLLISNN